MLVQDTSQPSRGLWLFRSWPVGRVITAAPIAIKGSFDAALLDFDLAGESVEPIANVLERRGIPFALITVSTRDKLPASLRESACTLRSLSWTSR